MTEATWHAYTVQENLVRSEGTACILRKLTCQRPPSAQGPTKRETGSGIKITQERNKVKTKRRST